jgi:hypothetical protein
MGSMSILRKIGIAFSGALLAVLGAGVTTPSAASDTSWDITAPSTYDTSWD